MLGPLMGIMMVPALPDSLGAASKHETDQKCWAFCVHCSS